MSDKPETLSAILAEMRREERPYGISNDRLRSYADRIEAAAELERIELREDEAKMLLREYAAAPDESLAPSALELKRELLRLAPAPGNAAAMRDALEQALAYCESDQKSGIAYSDNDVLVPMLRAALSVAARNCDRPECADVESAWATYCAETNRADCKGLARWLFAPAKEGGDHA